MKIAFSTLALALSWGMIFSAQAADRKIGNMIAVERTITNVYKSCIEQAASEKDPSTIYACKFDARNSDTDFAPSIHRLLRLETEDCSVEAHLQNSIILVMFHAKGASEGFASAKTCLRQAMNSSASKDSFKYVIYTVE